MSSPTPANPAEALFAIHEIFPAVAAGDVAFRAATVAHLASILTRGVPATLAAFLDR